MKKIILKSFLLSLLFINVSLASDYYFEGQFGSYDVDDVNTARTNGTVSGATFTNFGADLEYDDDGTIGFEVGRYVTNNFRIGLSYTNLSLDFERGTFVGTGSISISCGGNTVSGTSGSTFNGADAKSVCVEFTNHADMVLLKAYYEFDPINKIVPYLGFGIGEADIEKALEKESVKSLTVGANYKFNSSNGYAGIRFSMMEVDGPVDRLGISYQDIDLDAFELIIGTRF